MLVNSECEICQPGKYSLLPNAPVCKDCPFSATCAGGNDFNLKVGKWRGSFTSDDIYDCLLEEACVGGPGTEEEPTQCSPGYRGLLCHECDTYEGKRFTRLGQHSCA